MPHTIENFTQVKLILADNPEDDGCWRTCWDLSSNRYAMDELLKSGKLKSGETVPLSTGLLRNMLVKAQKDARGFQPRLSRLIRIVFVKPLSRAHSVILRASPCAVSMRSLIVRLLIRISAVMRPA